MIHNQKVKQLATELDKNIKSLEKPNAANLRKVFYTFAAKVKNESPDFIFDLAGLLFDKYGHQLIAYMLIGDHKEAIKKVDEKILHEFGRHLNSWGAADTFAGLLAGPAWKNNQIPDDLIVSWTRSEDRWWRRVALVCTIALNKRTWGGRGDIQRTLKICRLLAGDKDDMVAKAMSWALRELIPHEAGTVRDFLNEYDAVLAGRVRREVNNKLTTGLKNPRTKKK